MPYSIGVTFRGPAPDSPWQHSKGLRALVLRWVQNVDPDVSQALHDDPRPKPYSISPLWRIDRPGSLSGCSVEIAVGPDWLAELIVAGASRSTEITLGTQRYTVDRIQPDARPTTWHSLLEAEPVDRWRLEFVTPMAHRESDSPGLRLRRLLPLPVLDRCFGSWLDRWNRSAAGRWASDATFLDPDHRDMEGPLAMPDSLLDLVREHAVLKHVEGGTPDPIFLEPGNYFVGFVGRVEIELPTADRLAPEAIRRLNALIRFSQYCGTGVETARGMGVTRLLELETGAIRAQATRNAHGGPRSNHRRRVPTDSAVGAR